MTKDSIWFVLANGVNIIVDGCTGIRKIDVVDPSTVTARGGIAVLGIGEGEDVGTSGNGIRNASPVPFT